MRYGSVARRNFMVRHHLHKTGLVQSHHVIPKQFKTHPVIVQNRYDVNASGNLILMPTPVGKIVMKGIRADRLTHGWGHRRYDAYVKSMLDCIHSEEDLFAFRDYLRYVLRHEPHHVPWT